MGMMEFYISMYMEQVNRNMIYVFTNGIFNYMNNLQHNLQQAFIFATGREVGR